MTELSAEGVMGRKTSSVLMMCQMLKRREDQGTTWMLVIKLHLWRISDTIRSFGWLEGLRQMVRFYSLLQ